MELNFYHVMSGNLVPSVVKLLEKVYDSGKRSVFSVPWKRELKSSIKLYGLFPKTHLFHTEISH